MHSQTEKYEHTPPDFHSGHGSVHRDLLSDDQGLNRDCPHR